MAAADASLAAELGVSPEVIEDIRRNSLSEGEHWTRAEGNRVVFTVSGIAATRAALDLQKETPPLEKNAAAPCLCEVVRVHSNPAFIRVRVSDGSLHDVRVRNNRSLRSRVRVRCQYLPDGRWECCQPGIGVKLPPLEKKETPATP